MQLSQKSRMRIYYCSLWPHEIKSFFHCNIFFPYKVGNNQASWSADPPFAMNENFVWFLDKFKGFLEKLRDIFLEVPANLKLNVFKIVRMMNFQKRPCNQNMGYSKSFEFLLVSLSFCVPEKNLLWNLIDLWRKNGSLGLDFELVGAIEVPTIRTNWNAYQWI